MSIILRLFIIMVLPISLIYIIITLFGLVDKSDLFESKKEMKNCILKQILILVVLSAIIAIIIKNYNCKFLHILPFMVTLIFILYISIKKFKNTRLYEKYGYDSKIEFLYEILFIGLQLTLATFLGQIATQDNMKLPNKYYYISIGVYIVFKLIFLICGKKFSKKECLKNVTVFIFSFIFLTIAFSIKGFRALSDNSNFLWITYFSLAGAEALFYWIVAGAEAFFYWIAEKLKKK